MLQSTRLTTIDNTITSPLRGGKGGVLSENGKDNEISNLPHLRLQKAEPNCKFGSASNLNIYILCLSGLIVVDS
jgi:hypothetical protein